MSSFVRRVLGKLLRDRRGSSDLTVGLLMTAAGAAMVGMTVPSLFKSSDTAARTFDRQVKILERGTSGGTGAGGGGSGLTSLPTQGATGFEFGGDKNVGLSNKGGSLGSKGSDLSGENSAIVTPSGGTLTNPQK